MREEEEMGSSQSSGAVPSSPQEATRSSILKMLNEPASALDVVIWMGVVPFVGTMVLIAFMLWGHRS